MAKLFPDQIKGTFKRYRIFVLIVTFFFLTLFFVSYTFTLSQKSLLQKHEFDLREFYEEKKKIISENSFEEIFKRVQIILERNLKVFLLLLTGIFTLGFESLLQIGTIAWLMGNQIAFLVSKGVPKSVILSFILPHGIFELFGFFLAGCLGLRSAFLFAKYLFSRNQKIDVKNEIANAEIVFAISLFFILLAAYVEAGITPLCAKHFVENRVWN